MEYLALGLFGIVIISVLGVLLLKWLGMSFSDQLTGIAQIALDQEHASHPMVDSLAAIQLDEPVSAMRAVAFFADRAETPERELRLELHKRIESRIQGLGFMGASPERPATWWSIARSYQRGEFKNRAELDLLVVGEDPFRVWWEDLDQVRRGADAYVRLLRRWSEISRGAFAPVGISESWGADDGPVIVSFSINGVEQAFVHLTALDPQLDIVGLRAKINPLIATTGIQFEIIAVQGIPNVVVALTADERAHLTDVRGWSFTNLSAVVI